MLLRHPDGRVETLAGDFDASEFEDDYAGAVEALVQALQSSPAGVLTTGGH